MLDKEWKGRISYKFNMPIYCKKEKHWPDKSLEDNNYLLTINNTYKLPYHVLHAFGTKFLAKIFFPLILKSLRKQITFLLHFDLHVHQF